METPKLNHVETQLYRGQKIEVKRMALSFVSWLFVFINGNEANSGTNLTLEKAIEDAKRAIDDELEQGAKCE